MRSYYAFLLFFMAASLTAQSDLIITGVYDGPLTGGTPKGIELYATADIADLSIYGIGSANNGGGSDGEEFTFPADNVTAGTYIYWSTEVDGFALFFETSTTYTNGAASINGNDAIELFKEGAVVDVYGDINMDGSGQLWDYLDGWAYRVANTGPDGTTFELSNWTYSGINVFDGTTTNATAPLPMPIGTYGEPITPDHTVDIVGLNFQPKDLTIEIGETVLWTNTTGIGHNVNGSLDDYAMNPEGFFSGPPSNANWEFLHTFTIAGLYNYHCDPHLGAGMTGTITVNGAPPVAVDDNVLLSINGTSSTNVLLNDLIPDALTSFNITSMPSMGQAMIMGDSTIVYSPEQDECGLDSLTYEICTSSGCAFAQVNYDVFCPPNYPAYPISLLTTNNGIGIPDSLETVCEITGIVYGINYRPSGLQFTIIDKADADAGMGVFLNTGDLGYTVTEGDEIIVQGEVTFFSGLTQMRPDNIEVVSQGNSLHSGEILIDPLSEDTESKLVTIQGLIFVDESQWNPAGSGFNVTVDNGSNQYEMRIDADMELFNQPFPAYALFTLTGIGGQFDGDEPYDEGYQILPRTADDLNPVDAVTELNDDKFLLFPNPVKNELIIQTSFNWEKIEMYDVQGRLLFSKPLSGKNHQINTSQLSKGQYWIKLINSEGIQSKSFQKF